MNTDWLYGYLLVTSSSFFFLQSTCEMNRILMPLLEILGIINKYYLPYAKMSLEYSAGEIENRGVLRVGRNASLEFEIRFR